MDVSTRVTMLTQRRELRSLERRAAGAHARAENNNTPARRPARRIGSTRLSNTDSIRRAQRVRNRLRAKLGEIMQSNMERDLKLAWARTVKVELDRVERKIIQIRRRERAVEEEKRERRLEERRRRGEAVREETPAQRNRRRHDLARRSIRVRNDFLHSAQRGGFDPNAAGVQAPVDTPTVDVVL